MNVPEVMTLAQVNIDEGPLSDFATEGGDALSAILKIIVSIVAIYAIAKLLMKAFNAFKNQDVNDAVKHIGYAVAVAAFAVLSFSGIGHIGEALNPVHAGEQQENPFL